MKTLSYRAVVTYLLVLSTRAYRMIVTAGAVIPVSEVSPCPLTINREAIKRPGVGF